MPYITSKADDKTHPDWIPYLQRVNQPYKPAVVESSDPRGPDPINRENGITIGSNGRIEGSGRLFRKTIGGD